MRCLHLAVVCLMQTRRVIGGDIFIFRRGRGDETFAAVFCPHSPITLSRPSFSNFPPHPLPYFSKTPGRTGNLTFFF